MNTVTKLLTDHMDVWTAADTEKKSGRGRSAAGSGSTYGIKKLRELILELAVRGKLVPQDSNDEPSNQLLKRIEIERALLRKNGSIKPEKPFPRIDTKEAPFPVPDSWTWVNLAQIGHDWGQTTPEGQFTYIEVSAIDSNLGIVSSPEVVEANDAPSRARKIVRSGTVIYSTVRPYLRNIAVIEDDFSPSPIASTAFAVIHPFCEMPPRYILAYLRSPPFVKYVESVQTGIAYPAINDKQFFSGLFPLPPLAEQHRIVAKVDELMALCDQLEAGHAEAAIAHENLVTQLLGTLTASENAEDFATNWQRIAAHFNTLFTTESSIDALKQAILQLAVMGKLVPQDPADEPAAELLKRIKAKKMGLAKEGKSKKESASAPVKADEAPFDLPAGWQWSRLNDLANLITKGSSPKWQGVNYTNDSNAVMFITSENVGKYKLLLSEPKFVEPKFNEIEPRSILKFGDYLMNIVGASIGRTALFDLNLNANINQAVCLIRINSMEISPKFLLHFFNSETCLGYMFDKQVDNARPNLSMGNIARFAIPLPPLFEQDRIVAKVDELMALCDGLKARIIEGDRVQQTLADALVTQAVA